MASVFQGGALPDVRTTTSVNPNAPSYYTDYMSALSKAGTQQLGMPSSQLVAGFSPLQQQAFSQLPNVAGSYKPTMASAVDTASQGAAGATPQNVQSMLNPYTSNVVDEMARLTNQNVNRSLIPQLKGAFVGTGGLGGQRYATATGQTLADVQSTLTGQQQGALTSGYNQALQAALQNAQQKTSAAQTQGMLAKTQQDLGLAGINAQMGAGAQQQALEQARINAPLQNAINASALMRGYNVPIGTTETFTGPKAGVYAQSPLSQIAGSASLVGALFGGQGKEGTGQSVVSSGLDWLNKKLNVSPTISTSPSMPAGYGANTSNNTYTVPTPSWWGQNENPIQYNYNEYSNDPYDYPNYDDYYNVA
jgi:hypothetical protein